MTVTLFEGQIWRSNFFWGSNFSLILGQIINKWSNITYFRGQILLFTGGKIYLFKVSKAPNFLTQKFIF